MKRETTAKRLRQVMEQRQLRQVDVLKLCEPYCKKFDVCLGKSLLSQYLSGNAEPGPERLSILCSALGVSEAWLMGFDVPAERGVPKSDTFDVFSIPNIIPVPEMRKIPLLGTISCKDPILAAENISEYVDIPKSIAADFALTCHDDSMINARIFNGDIVYIRQQEQVENGEIAAVLVDNEATLKRFYKTDNSITLMSENNRYAPIVFTGESMDIVRIIGRAISFVSSVL